MSGSTTQFILAPEGRRSNRQYLLAVVSFFWTICLVCTIATLGLDVITGGSLALLGSPFVVAAALIPNIGIAFVFPFLQRFQRTHR